MRFLRSLPVAIALVAIVAPRSVTAQSIGLFADQAATDCDLNVAIAPVTFYVAARLGGPAANGIQGAEFRIDNLPASWFLNWTCADFGCGDFPPPGGPGSGVFIAWPTCKTGAQGVVLLGTLDGFAASNLTDHRIRIRGFAYPGGPPFPCPTLVLCDSPIFTKFCVPGGELIVNGPPCTVGVQPTAWSQVKAMFD